MATATKVSAFKIVQRPVRVEIARITLDLNLKEAEFLRFLLDRVAGDPVKSPRKFSNSINQALREAGVDHPAYDSNALDSAAGSCLAFLFKDNANTLEKRRIPAAYYEYPEGLIRDWAD